MRRRQFILAMMTAAGIASHADAQPPGGGGRGGGGGGSAGACQRGGGRAQATAGNRSASARTASLARHSSGQSAVAPGGGNTTSPNELMAQILRQFDTDGDGKLTDAEVTKLIEEMKRRGFAQQYIAATLARLSFLARFDTDSDGQLSPSELATAKQVSQSEAAEKKSALKAKSTKSSEKSGSVGTKARVPTRKQQLLAKFDIDRDGKLSTAEKVEMQKAVKAEREAATTNTVAKS